MNTSTILLDSYILASGGLALKTDYEKANEIIKIVCDFYKVEEPYLKSNNRRRRVVEPRSICFHLLRKYTNLTLIKIGGLFGGRDHTTILHGIRSLEDLCDYDAKLSQNVEIIENKYKENNQSRLYTKKELCTEAQ